MYAIKTGDRQGGFMVWVKEYDKLGSYAFLFMPEPMESIYISKQEVETDFKSNFDFVDILPIQVYDVCAANWKYYAEKAGIK